MWMIHTLISNILSLLFPKQCIKCHKEGESFCVNCLHFCKKSIDTPHHFCISVYCFKDPLIKKAIHAIKYFHKKDLIHALTQELAIEIEKKIKTYPNGILWELVPVPMPRLRKYIRGYNQAELIAEEIARHIPTTQVRHALIRISSPKRQVTTKTRSERLKNQKNSFKVAGEVAGKHLILIDDVTTTGATLLEARGKLLKAGAITVLTATIAH